MTAKHTPGPWSVAEGDGCFIVETNDSVVRFEVAGLDMEGDRYNARLIAAAPDLLEALEAAVARQAYRPGEGPEWWEQSRAAIAKAIGDVSI